VARFGTVVWTSAWGVLTCGRPGLALVVLSVVEQWLDAVRAVLAGAEVTEAAAVQVGVHRSTVHRLGRAVPDGAPGRVGGPVAPAVVVASAGGSCDRGRGGRNASGASAGEMAGEFINRAPTPERD